MENLRMASLPSQARIDLPDAIGTCIGESIVI